MPGALRRGRPCLAWIDNIKTWTGLSVEESIRMTEDRHINGEGKSMVWPTLGSRTAKEQKRTEQNGKDYNFNDCNPPEGLLNITGSHICWKYPFNGLFSRTTWVRWHQKNKKTILDFNDASDDGVAVASAGPYENHLHFAPHSRQTTTVPPPHHSVFLQTGCSS